MCSNDLGSHLVCGVLTPGKLLQATEAVQSINTVRLVCSCYHSAHINSLTQDKIAIYKTIPNLGRHTIPIRISAFCIHSRLEINESTTSEVLCAELLLTSIYSRLEINESTTSEVLCAELLLTSIYSRLEINESTTSEVLCAELLLTSIYSRLEINESTTSEVLCAELLLSSIYSRLEINESTTSEVLCAELPLTSL